MEKEIKEKILSLLIGSNESLAKFLSQNTLSFFVVGVVLTFVVIVVTGNIPEDNTTWALWLTAAGTLFGFYGIWLTLKIFKMGEALSNSHSDLLNQVRLSVMSGLKLSRFDSIRTKIELAKLLKDNDAEIYWNFLWRFETFDEFGLVTNGSIHLDVRVLGTNNPPLLTEIELQKQAIYSVEIESISGPCSLKLGPAYCTFSKGKLYISNNAEEDFLLPPMVEFQILRLGGFRTNFGKNQPSCYKRLKQLDDPTISDEDTMATK